MRNICDVTRVRSRFPAARSDDEDGGDHARAAMRELHEEIGIPPSAVTIAGRLDPIKQRQNVFTVTPFAGIVTPHTPIVLDLNEASAAHTVPLAAILEPGAVHAGIETVGDRAMNTIHFDYGALHVWGLTGQILNAFVREWNRAGSELRAAINAQLLP